MREPIVGRTAENTPPTRRTLAEGLRDERATLEKTPADSIWRRILEGFSLAPADIARWRRF